DDVFDALDAGLILANQQAHVNVHIADGEVHDLSAVFGDGDTVSGSVELAVRHSLDHAIPASLNVHRGAVQAGADLIPGIVVPAARDAGLGVHIVEGQVGVLDG